ncbi:hypothetical protein KI688_008623 [Linnemannia hyalina]|uniref:Uncharacterized protein n=1 Tax=Linnemannia hyalina TaxID=64524 RepID=A0A9P8BWM9_9FUNG|nr:hypothetical protein KI688_008623 [Linnemannia hyalina]
MVCLFSFGVPALTTATAMIILRHKSHNFTAAPRKYFCDFEDLRVALWTFGVPMLLTAVPSVLFASFGVIVIMLFAQQVIEAKDNTKNDPARRGPDRDFPIFSDFSDSVGGISFFIIFGTTRAALDTLGYLLSCGCIRTRLERRRHRHDPRAEMHSTMQEMYSTMLVPTATMSPYVIHPLVAVPAQIYNPDPDFKNYPK